MRRRPRSDQAEVTQFCEIWFRDLRRDPTAAEHKQLNGIIDKAVARFQQLIDEDKEAFKGKLLSFRKLYAFLAQIIPYQDSEFEKLYTYARFLLLKLPRRATGPGYELEDEVALRFYRLEKRSEGAIDLEQGEAQPLKGPTEASKICSRSLRSRRASAPPARRRGACRHTSCARGAGRSRSGISPQTIKT